MSTTAFATRRGALKGLCLILVWISHSVHADFWGQPEPFDVRSENGKFTAHVNPASKSSKATLVVFAIKGHRTNELWQATLSNLVAPSQVAVSDGGTSVVTVDNWGRLGYGEDVVAVYGPGGQKAKYSLQEFAPPSKQTRSAKERSPLTEIYGGYEALFSQSDSSRDWQKYSINFFCRDAGEELFCLWLDWDNRWVVWQMSDGKLREVAAVLVQNLNAEGRRRALKKARTGSNAPAALNFLGRLRHPEDRPLIEAWLRDPEFSRGSTTTYHSTDFTPSFCYNAISHNRQEAENILSCWDGLRTNISVLGSVEHYCYLGTIKGQVSLDANPKRGDGTLRLYLIPRTVPLAKWSKFRPEHYLIADLCSEFPTYFAGQTTKDLQLGRSIDFALYGITPGQFRLKAVWNRMPPFTRPDTIVCLPHPGDSENVSSPLISVNPGEIVDGVQVECTTPAGKQLQGISR